MKFFDLLRPKQAPAPEPYDRENLTPVIRSGICTGEKVAGFRERSTGRFREVMLVRDESDLEAFRARYGITGPIDTIY